MASELGRRRTLIILLAGSALSSVLVSQADGYLIYALIALIGFFYGGFLSTFPSLTAELFGPRHMATNYGFVLLGFGAGAIISSYVAGHYKNLAAQDISLMCPAFFIAAGCALLGIVLMLLLKSGQKNANS